tara:strand:+ start:686 stop:958 length:273 start_codon:yes stop_codon:yes gene_type:complete
MFAALSEDSKQMNDKINVFIAMAPLMTFKGLKDEFLLDLVDRNERINRWSAIFGIEEYFGPSWGFINSGFCFWNQDFCRSSNSFVENQRA